MGNVLKMVNDDINFSDLFDLHEIQKLQNLFADANGVASIITSPDGKPITQASNFTRLCSKIIRETEKGKANCFKSDAIIGRMNLSGPIVQPCLSCGLWDAGVSIAVEGHHIANWLIGQVRNEKTDHQQLAQYADEIGADKYSFFEALNEVPVMSVEQFNKVAQLLYVFANELSAKAYINFQLKKQTELGLKATELLENIEEKFQLMFENSLQPMIIAGSKTLSIIEVNQAFIDLYGYSKNEVQSMTLKDIHCADSSSLIQDKGEKSKGVYYSTKEARHRIKNGEIIIVEVSFDSVYYKKNDVLHVLITDLTEQRKTEEALKKSEEKFRHLFETMQNGFYRSTPEGYFIDANPSFIKMLGYKSKEELLKVYIPTDCYVSNDERDVLIQNPSVLDNGVEEYRLKKKDGSIIWIEDNASYIKNDNGKIIFHEGVCNDITLRKKAEEKLYYEQFLMNFLMENLPQNIYFKNLESKFIKISNAHAKFFNLSNPAEAIGKSDFDFFTHEHASQAFEDEQRMIRTGEPIIGFEEKETWEEGRVTWVTTTKLPMRNNEGNIIGTMGISSDITQRKLAEEKIRESEEKLSTLFKSMTEMVALHELVFDDNGDAVNYFFTDCNNAFTSITGLKREDVIGKLATEVYKTETAPYLDEFRKVALSGEPYDYTTYFAPMDLHFIVSVVSPRKNHFATITTDITDLKQTQEAITTKKNELENYLYIASHDLRSPMVNIQGFSQRLIRQSDAIKEIISNLELEPSSKSSLDKIINEGVPKTLNFILSNVAKMDILISGLLQLSRTGRIKMNIQQVDTDKLVKSIIESNNFQLSEVSAKVIINQLPSCYGDENQLNQLFSNIIGNAFKYRDKTRQLVIEIDGKVIYNKVLFSVKDNGIGIPERYLEKIWDVFFRVDPSSTESGEGIGLSLAKRIIDKNRGKIWVESEEGKGTTFYIELQKKVFQE